MKYFLLILIAIVLTSCQQSVVATKSNVAVSSVTVSPIVTVKNINFNLTSFSVTYDNNSTPGDDYTSDRYTGNGIITAVGEEGLVKLPYEVLVDVTKVSGGDDGNYNDGPRLVVVENGIGTFKTSDSQFKKNAPQLPKPVYEIKIVGYLPFNKLDPKSN